MSNSLDTPITAYTSDPIELLSRHLARFWERRYRAAFAAFDQMEPPLPVRWDNWRQANEREKRKNVFLSPVKRNLGRARARTRDIICLSHA